MTTLGTTERPLRVAIIGSGPSGFYAVDALYKSDLEVNVDMYDRLATPYGLLRGGVAPDHQQMKTLERYYERIATKNTSFSFYGNVQIGRDLTINELKEHYDAIICACGAETDRKLNIPGESLPGSHTATEFVGWYNGHPDYQHLSFDLSQKEVAIIGQGNVAIDVARILGKTIQELSTSDITQHALDELDKSQVETIHLIGRRGPVQAAFTQLEIKELGELDDCDVQISETDLQLNPESQEELDDPKNNKARKNMAILEAFSNRPKQNKRKTIVIHFFKSPTEIKGDNTVTGLTLETNKLQGEAGQQKARGTGQTSPLPCQLIFRSVGYRGIPMPGLPFDDKKGILPNENGRLINEDNTPMIGVYAVGWIKRGPSGVLGSNKPDSTDTVKTLFSDLQSLTPCKTPSTQPLLDKLDDKEIPVVTFDDWKQIDNEEKQRGEKTGKPREKFTSSKEILSFLKDIKIVI